MIMTYRNENSIDLNTTENKKQALDDIWRKVMTIEEKKYGTN
jgi:RNA polymerase-binding transcription factor DksA